MLHEYPAKIGTRGSPLALAQAAMVAEALHVATGSLPQIEIVKTSGDLIQDRALALAGGKGLFTKEIDEAQLAGKIAVAVHSAKDLPTILPDGLVIAGYLARADIRDAFIGHNGIRFRDLPSGARIGSASLRRQAQILRLRPDIRVELIRGNVDTRLRKVHSGEFDGTLLALAGLTRLGLEREATEILSTADFLPAVAQGAIALVARVDDAKTRSWIGQINHPLTQIAVDSERAFLHELDGSCRTPIAGLATIEGTRIHLQVQVLSPDGRHVIADQRAGNIAQAQSLGQELGKSIRTKLPENFFDTVS